MKNHFTISHPQEVIPEVAMIPEEEQNLIKKKKSFRKNALKKEDLERFVDKELFVAHHRLLGHQEENVEIEHVRQFWEAEQRMKNIFGKQNFEWFSTLTRLNIFFKDCLQNIYY